MTELRYGGTLQAENIAWQKAIVAFAPSYALGADGKKLKADGWIGHDDAKVAADYRARRKLPPPPTGVVVTHEEYAALVKTAPPALRARHLAVVFRGTGGVIGQDYVSRVCQGVADLVEEVNPEFPASMGGFPPGAPGTPSGAKAVQIGFENGKRVIIDAINRNPNRKVILGGYSLGAIVAAMLRKWMHETYPQNYLCSFSFGDPTRPLGGSYFLGPVPAGHGISTWRYGDPLDWRHCYLTHPDDMYANIPLGAVGDIIDDFFDAVTNIEMSDPTTLITKMLPMILGLLPKAGIELPMVLGAVAGGIPGMIGLAIPILIGMMPSLIGGLAGGGMNYNNLTGPAAAGAAGIIAMKFLFSGTAPHINYHAWEVWPGQTYLGLAIQHVRDHASRVPAR